MTRILALLCFVLAVSPAIAHDFVLGALQIGHPHIPVPPRGAKVAAGYFSIANTGTTDDRLIGITTDFAKMSMLHESRTDADGIVTMSHLDGLDIAAGELIELAPGGYHVMFMGPTISLVARTRVPATLTFEKAGIVAVEFTVDASSTAAPHDHGAAPSQ